MAILYGKEMSRQEIMKRIGDISQIAGAKPCALSSGQTGGMNAVDIRTGAGLQFTILPGLGMNIAWAEFKGIPVSFISKSGFRSSETFDEDGHACLKNLTSGLLATSGFTDEGTPPKMMNLS
jgi:hypothetical protein